MRELRFADEEVDLVYLHHAAVGKSRFEGEAKEAAT